jgi:hypothetical protein
VSFFLTTAPDRGETILVRPVMEHVQISSVFLHVCIRTDHSSVLHYSDGMNCLLADGTNSLRKGCDL